MQQIIEELKLINQRLDSIESMLSNKVKPIEVKGMITAEGLVQIIKRAKPTDKDYGLDSFKE